MRNPVVISSRMESWKKLWQNDLWLNIKSALWLFSFAVRYFTPYPSSVTIMITLLILGPFCWILCFRSSEARYYLTLPTWPSPVTISVFLITTCSWILHQNIKYHFRTTWFPFLLPTPLTINSLKKYKQVVVRFYRKARIHCNVSASSTLYSISLIPNHILFYTAHSTIKHQVISWDTKISLANVKKWN